MTMTRAQRSLISLSSALLLMTSLTPSASAQDADADGVSDAEESTLYMTNPALADSDLDGLSDGDEVFNLGTNPLSADTDNGGVPDLLELLQGTDPLVTGDDDSTLPPQGRGPASYWATTSAPLSTRADAALAINAAAPNTSRAFIFNAPINISSQPLPGPHGPFADHLLVQSIFGAALSTYAGSFSGWLTISPADAANPTNTYTFAVSSDDGFELQVFDGTTIKQAAHDGARTIATGPLLVVDFPDEGGLFPLSLLHWDSDNLAGLKLSWAPGDLNAFDPTSFTLIEPARLISPEVTLTQRVDDLNGGAIEPGDTLEVVITMTNTGLTRSGQLTLSPSLLTGATFSQYTQLPTNAQPRPNALATLEIPFIDRQATMQVRYTVVVEPASALNLQSMVSVETFSVNPGLDHTTLHILSDDPLITTDQIDSGNKPEGIFGASAVGDDDANVFIVGQDITLPSINIDYPQDNSTTLNSTPLIYGFSEPGATVTVTLDNQTPVDITADVTGAWHLSSSSLMPGVHTVRASATDAAGNSSATQPLISFTVDANAFPLSLDNPKPNEHTNTAQLNYVGQTLMNTAVKLTSYNSMGAIDDVGNVNTNSGTSYGYITPFTLSGGPQVIEVTATQNGRTATLIVPFVVDVFPAGVFFTDPSAGQTVNKSRPTMRGTTDPFALVELELDQAAAGSTRANAQGQWQFTPAQPLSEGAHVARARATDVAGNVGLFFNLNFFVDTIAPPLTVTSPAMNAHTRNPRPTITGTTEPNATISLSIDQGATITLIADAQGRWSHGPAQDLSEGAHQVTVIASDAVGNQSAPTTRDFTIDTTAPTITITAPTDNQLTGPTPMIVGQTEAGVTLILRIDGGAPISVSVDALGQWMHLVGMALNDGPHRALATVSDAAGNSASDTVDFIVDATAPTITILAPQDGQTLETDSPTISGTAEPGAMVEVFVNNQSVGVTTADQRGDWSLTPQAPLPSGALTVRATATDGAGNTASDIINITIALPNQLTITAPAQGDMVSPDLTVKGQAAPNATVEVFVDDQKVGETTADAQGAWSLDVTGLSDGAHTINATSDAQTSETINVTVSTPGTIAITAPQDGQTVSDKTPMITGTAPAGATVTVIINGQEAGQTTADAQGVWSFQTGDDHALVDGPNTIEATTTDASGAMLTTGQLTISYDAQRWEVTITTPEPNAKVSPTPTISGTAAPGATVEVFVDGQKVGEATADEQGAWSATIAQDQALAPGTRTISARATLGEQTKGSNEVVVTVVEDVQPQRGFLVTGGAAGCSATGDATGGAASALLMLIMSMLFINISPRRRRRA